jgi:AraC family transcriptional regulator of arabinose operon
LWAHFQPRPAWHDWLRWPERWPGFLHLTLDDPGIRERVTCRLADAHALWSRGDLGGGAGGLREMLAMNALEEALLWCDTENPLSEQARMHPKVRAAMDFLSRNLAAKVTLDDAASACGLSVSRLSHLFREQVGTTPQQFLERLRLDRARQLLELTGRSVASVAAEVGFDSPFYFSSRFKKHTGFSPRDYRRRTPG